MKIAIFTGPTGGHFYPALAFLEAFKRNHPQARILLVTGRRGRFLVEKARGQVDFEFDFLPDFPFPRPGPMSFFIRFPLFLLQLAKAFLKAEKILDRFKPELAMGFGSYVSFPGLVASFRRKIPTLIHEQNRVMGRANKRLVCFAQGVALSFEPEKGKPVPKRFVVSGLPLRASLVRAAQVAPPKSTPVGRNRIKILVVGGSQGSESLNRLWNGVIRSLSNEEKLRIAVIHITGEKNYEAIKAMYSASKIEAMAFPFHERMEEIYSEADLAVTRAGASTLFELALFGLPAVVVPYPHADGHQEENACYFENRGGIFLLPEGRCTVEHLKRYIFEIAVSQTLRNRMSMNLRHLARADASEKLVEWAEKLATQKEVCLR